MIERVCSVEGCGGKHYALGLCRKHYRSCPEVKKRKREYRQRPEVKERRRERRREYYSRPEFKKRRREYLKEYCSRPEVKELAKEKVAEFAESLGYTKKTAEAYAKDGLLLEQREKELKNEEIEKNG